MKSAPESRISRRRWWRLPLLLAIVLIAILLSRDWGVRDGGDVPQPQIAEPPAGADTGETVSLTINFGGGRREQFPSVSWREGITVRDALIAAGAGSSGGIGFAEQGTGESGFLTSIDDVANEGAEGSNWTYTVNGKLGDRSFAVFELEPGDQVLWTFAAEQ